MGGDELRGSDDEDLTMFGSKFAANDPEAHGRVIEVRPKTRTRKIWTAITWLLTFWIPSFCLNWVGRMKRPDVRMAWREKVAICILIVFLNAALIFYMVGLRLILCPDYDDAYSAEEVSYHTTSNDFYVSIHGKVYDISKFWKLQHSDNGVDTTTSTMEVFAGLDLSNYFPPPLTVVCSDLVTDESVYLYDNTTVTYSTAVHWSGPKLQSDEDSALYDISWYKSTFLPKIKQYYKGDLVVKKSTVESYGENGYDNWAIIDGKIYDLTNYFYTIDLYPSSESDSYAVYDFLDSDVKQLFSDYPGQDITDYFYDTSTISASTAAKNLKCLNGAFYAGKVDFRESARCTVSNYILLAMAGVLCFVILFKFIMSLQFGSKPMPTMQDKFVICQIPAYTEGEDELRRAIDSLTALQYDNKRKLLFIICDGMIIGSGNEKPTPNIVLELLGADPRLDPPALPFRSVGEGSAQLNYGKVYSGLYEFEGNVVPYVVVVKVGKPTEKSRPGNRGKRDSQILLMDFLNKVHFQAAMSPLQLEIFHQINNVIGVDPELYEYVLMVDADTSVMPDSLNRLVAKCVQDSRIAGIAGETSLTNQEKSWWTMIQVFEYYISHHLSKSFESLFGSVTCLPGCFSMYRLRTADKAKPLIIANAVLEAYSDGDVNTLHKKNLLSLGEDRFLTTLMTKHFPRMRYVFAYDAHAETDAPASWSVLLSQRRRWINSTIHNLAELAFLPDLCGFCLFSMRFVIVMDLFGTLMLPSVMVYMVYIIYKAVVDPTNFPLISVCMIAAIYGIQALVFLLRRQWQQIGWMVIYLLAYPIYSFVLPVYSFWNQDNFSWGNTRIVVGERGNKEIIAINDEGFDERSIPLQTWEEYATHNNLPGRVRPHIIPSVGSEKAPGVMYTSEIMKEESYEMEDMRSVYSSYPPPAMSVYSGVQNTPHPQSQYGGRPGSVAYGYSAPSPGAYAPHPGYAASQYAPSVAPSAYTMGTQYQQRPQPMSGMTLYQQQNVLLDQQRQAGYDGRSTPYGR
ncbi:chitin synthase [Myxozyma melibiosi]|uniref:chitin synthase n=1 Tax=Myxozyma melibiosi TaxID=54550 RepID=A0ABR1FAY2_9ASCO